MADSIGVVDPIQELPGPQQNEGSDENLDPERFKQLSEEPNANVSLTESQAHSTTIEESGTSAPVDKVDIERSDAVSVPTISPLEGKIIRQIEFYFGDRNFPKDKHLQQAVSADANGWVPLTYLLNFNRLKELSTDVLCIYNALLKATAGVIEVKEGEHAIRRNPTRHASLLRTKEEAQEIRANSVYAKGFPLDASFDNIQQFFDQYGRTKIITMRRNDSKKFKGSVFVEFEAKVDADSFLSHSSVKYQDQELLRESKEAYHIRKKQQLQQSKLDGDSTSMVNRTEKLDQKSPETSFPSGAILHFKGCGEKTRREDIKEVVAEYAEVAWIDFNQGCTEGYVRFTESGDAQRAMDGLIAAGSQLNGAKSELRVLEGEEEKTYWSNQIGQHSRGKRGKGQRGRGGRGGRNWKGQRRHNINEHSNEGSGAPVRKRPKRETEHVDDNGDE